MDEDVTQVMDTTQLSWVRATGVMPVYKTSQSSGFDFVARTCDVLFPGEVKVFPTGLFLTDSVPVGFELQVRSRSGLAAKHGVVVVNSPGTVDRDFRQEIGVILINHGKEPFFVTEDMRIAQGVFCPIIQAPGIPVEEVVRSGGFGSTGI